MEQTMGKRIAQHRKRMAMTQDALAEQLGVTAQAVSKWENDQSCPDISMLPKLARIFGISTDALLGIEMPETVQLEAASEGEASEGGEANWEFNLDNSGSGRLGLALWVLLTGGLLFASGFYGWRAGLWDILWPSGLLVFGLFGIYPKFSFFRMGCGLLGGYFLLNNLNAIPILLGKEMILPAFLVLFGLCLLSDALRKPASRQIHIHGKGNPGKNEYKAEGERFVCSTSFGENVRKIELPCLSSGEARLSFGELDVDLTGCTQIADGCTVDVQCSFGELTLYVPRCCRVEPNVRTCFAAMSVDGDPGPRAERTLYLKGSVNFGQICVKYI